MNKEEKLREILKGIDKTQTDSEDGWWETSTGAEFGAKKLKQLIDLVRGSEWVSVDTPPEYDVAVDALVFSTENEKYQRRVTDMLYSKRLGFEFSQRYHPAEYVAYWMPLPSPPTNKGESK